MMQKFGHSIREYEALRAVISSGTTVGASRRLGISQSAVSRAIANLEARLNCILFDRENGRISPTSAAVRLNSNLDNLFDVLSNISGADWAVPTQERLRLAAPPTLVQFFLQQQLASFLRLVPNRTVDLEVCSSDDLVSGLHSDRYDLAFASSDLTQSGVKVIPFLTGNAVCVMPKGHELERKKVVTSQDLDGHDMIALSRRHASRGKFDFLLRQNGAQVRIAAETATASSALEFVREGIGLTVINPFPLFLVDDDSVTIRPFQPEIRYQTNFAIPSHRPAQAIVRAFMRHLRLHLPKNRLFTRVP
ncbi:MAG: LysR family transcriptional regulator [Rhodobacteraceae bacterium]|nr:LysR family transcriptional regulator [Paracoccaceae bacterium]